MTRKGYEKLQKELERLKRVERPKNIADIAEARAHGDLSENAEYSAAKEHQSFLEGKIREIETKLVDSQVIETANLSTEKVVFGATVVLIDVETEEERKYTLVGMDEADLKENKISIHSPVAKALIGQKVSVTVKIKAPARTIEYQISKIFFEET
ncbi:MAG: transcription elongation factor GreA [Nitrospirae bacterium]|nr:transcription elongation factor GreA [Nitrospirota bacterium]MBI3352630.1 transcription elongation factor GreA [Nitrospirota bacterium]